MPKGVLAYRSKGLLKRLAVGKEVPEPYASFLHLHGCLGGRTFTREALAEARVTDVMRIDDGFGITRTNGTVVKIPPKAIAHFAAYIRGYLALVESEWLFPLPRDSQRPLNVVVAKRHLRRLTDNPPAE